MTHPFAQAAWKAANNVEYTFLSDYNREVVNSYDVALPGLAGMQGYVAAKRAVTIVDGEASSATTGCPNHPPTSRTTTRVRAAVAALS